MAHSVNIAGEVHEIRAGKCNIAGEAHEIKCGHVNIGGESHDIKFGVRWLKYKCERALIDYQESYADGSKSFQIGSTVTLYSTCTGNSSDGTYTLTNPVETTITVDSEAGIAGNIRGLYLKKDNHSVYRFESSSGWNSMGKIFYNARIFTYTARYAYNKVGTSTEVIEVSDGELPEDGTLVNGSVNGSYCVLEVGSTYYYYVREE